MAEVEALCPSGLKVIVRGLKGIELDTFANKQKAKKQNVGLQIAAACTRKVIDPGPYTLQADESLVWGDVLIGDLTYLTLMIRHASFQGSRDEKFSFKTKCPDEDCYHHENGLEWELDLKEDMPVKRWSKKDREKFETGAKYFTELQLMGYTGDPEFDRVKDGKYIIEHKLLCGRDQKKKNRSRQMDQEHQATQSLMQRIVSITTTTPEGKQVEIERNDMRDWLGELDIMDIESIVESMDEVDCGVDTSIVIECPRCDEEWDVELPFADFWKRKKARS